MIRLLALIVSLVAAFALNPVSAADASPRLGLQSWTCRNMSFDQVVEFASRNGITQVEFTNAHLELKQTPEELQRKKALLKEKGVTAYAFGVASTGVKDEDNRPLFELAKAMEIRLIIVEPQNPASWDSLEKLAKEYDVRLAIHNHGAGSAFGDPAVVKAVLATRDARIGVCLDVGWITAAGFDAAKVLAEYGDRVYDMHFKDKMVERTPEGKWVSVDTEIGKGNANYKGLFEVIRKTRWSGVLAIETDSRAFAEDPQHLVGEAKHFFLENFPESAK